MEFIFERFLFNNLFFIWLYVDFVYEFSLSNNIFNFKWYFFFRIFFVLNFFLYVEFGKIILNV